MTVQAGKDLFVEQTNAYTKFYVVTDTEEGTRFGKPNALCSVDVYCVKGDFYSKKVYKLETRRYWESQLDNLLVKTVYTQKDFFKKYKVAK